MRRAAIYARISEDATGTGLGVDRQVSACEDLVQARGWDLVTVYRDNDISATRSACRPGYEAMLAAIEAGEVSAVAVWALDRLHRRPVELETFISLVERHGVALANVAGEVDLSTDMGQLQARIMGAVAANESRTIGRRVRAKQQQLRDAGMPFGGGIRAFGWEPDRVTPIPSEVEEIQRMVAWVLSGRSLSSLVRDLNTRGVPTVSQTMAARAGLGPRQRKVEGRPWHLTSVRSVLTKPRLAGLLTHKGEVVGTGAWEPVVDRETFDRLQAVLAQRATGGRSATRGRKYLLSGIAECGTCGTPLQAGSETASPDSRRYRCPQSQRGETKGSGLIHGGRNMRALDQHVVNFLMQVLDVQRTHHDEDYVDVGPEVDRLRARLQQAADQFADDLIDAQQLATITKRLRARIDTLEAARPVITEATRLEWYTGAVDLDDARAAFVAFPIEVQRRVVVEQLGRGGHVRVHPSTKRGHKFDPTSVDVLWTMGGDVTRGRA